MAALSSPSMLADIFIKMEPNTGCPLGNVRKQAAEYRTQKAGECINQSAILADFHDTQPKSFTTWSSQRYSKAVFEESQKVGVHDRAIRV